MVPRLAIALTALVLLTTAAAAQTDPGDVQRRLRHAEALERAGQYSRALLELDALLESAPALPGAILTYERICRRQGRLERALPVLQRALGVDPGSTLLRQTQLRVLADLGRLDEVRSAGERWLILAPRSELAYREYAAALGRVGQIDEAEALLARGLESVERPETLSAALADLYLSQRRWSELAGEWLSLLRTSPAAGWELINFRLESMGLDAASAAKAVLGRVEDDSSSTRERQLAAIAALYAGRPEEARGRAENVLDELEASARQAFVNRLARVAADQRREKMVAWAYRRMLRDAPSDTLRWDIARRLVQLDLSAADTTSALETLGSVLGSAASGTLAHRWASATQIRLSAARGESRAARRAFKDHADLYPQDAELPLLALSVAEANLRQGHLDAAEDVLDLIPRSGSSLAVTARLSADRAYLALYAGRYDEARAELEVAAAKLRGAKRGDALRLLGVLRNGNEPELRVVAAAHRALLAEGPLAAAKRLWEELDRVPASPTRPALLLWAGELALAAGALERAEQLLRRIPDIYPEAGEAPVALVAAAEALDAAGRRADAIAALERLILEYPNSALTPLGRRRLAELREEVPRS